MEYLHPSSDVVTPCYGGAAGGGKSYLGCDWQLKRRLHYPNTRGMIARNELKDLKLTTMKTFWGIAGKIGLQPNWHYKYNEQLSVITFYNKSEIYLAEIEYRPSDPDYNYLGSYELSDAFVDEAQGVPGGGIDILRSRIRYNLIGGKPKMLLTCNPAKGYLYNNWYKPYIEGKLPPDKAFIPSLLSDNTEFENREVYEQMLMQLSERDRKRLLEGNWDYDDSPDILFDRLDMNQMFVSEIVASGEGYITCDPAAMGNDRTVIIIWRGLHIIKIVELNHKYPHEVAAILRELATQHGVKLRSVIVDGDGLGIGVVGLLKCIEFKNGGAALDNARFANMKAQCYFKLSELIRENKLFVHDHSKREDMMKELDLVRDRTKNDSKKEVTRKDEIKALLGRSPDYADAIMMRMYWELFPSLGKYIVG